MKNLVNVILCGGSGTRLWPLSRQELPKQFMQIFGGLSTFQLAMKSNALCANQQIVVSNANYRTLIKAQAAEIKGTVEQLLLEPCSCNTAAAIALAAFALPDDAIALVTPADHLIGYSLDYYEAVQQAYGFASQGYIVCLGIKPIEPHTGYGYIEASDFDVTTFHEKPSLEQAEIYIKQGNFLWNSGIFVFCVKDFLKALEVHAHEIYQKAKETWEASLKQEGEVLLCEEKMRLIPALSIDYALMEKLESMKVVPAKISWNDIGEFEALAKAFPADPNNNVSLADNVHYINSSNCFVFSTGRLVANVGVEDLIVIDTKDVLLIAKKGKSHLARSLLSSATSPARK